MVSIVIASARIDVVTTLVGAAMPTCVVTAAMRIVAV